MKTFADKAYDLLRKVPEGIEISGGKIKNLEKILFRFYVQ